MVDIRKIPVPVLNLIKKLLPSSGKTDTQPTSFHGGGGGGYGNRYYGDSQSAGGKWNHSLSNPYNSLHLNHKAIRQNARVMMQDSPQGRAIVQRKVDAVAHTGLMFESTPDAKILGITQESAGEWGRNVSNRFHLYSGDKKQHRSETLTFYQSHRLYSLFQERDNDVFVRLYYSPDKNLQNPLQFEFVEPDQIRGDAFTTSYGFQTREDGIIRDDRGRETGFKVWIRNKEGQYEEVDVQAKGPKSGRLFMLHGYQPEYAGQGRGFSKLAPILQELENFQDFTSANIKQAINQAQIVGWVVPSKDEDTTPIFDANLTDFGAGPAGDNFSGEEATDDPSLIAGDFNCYSLPEATFGVPGSTFIQELTKGADIKLANPNAPSTGYDAFQNAFLTSLSSVTGMPLEMVHMKFGSNYAANRATLLLAYRVIEIERQEMASDYLDPFIEMWLSGEIAAGRISAPGWSDPRLKAAWLKSTWRGTGVPDIDPAKLAKARKDNLEIGATNVERESQQHSGLSAIDNIGINNEIYANHEQLPWSANLATDEPPDDDIEKGN